MWLSAVARCHRFPTVTSILFTYRSPLNGPIRHFRSAGHLKQINDISAENLAAKNTLQNAFASYVQFNQVMGLPQDELDLPVAAPSNCVSNSHYWQRIPFWKNVGEVDFLSYQWQVNKDFLMDEP